MISVRYREGDAMRRLGKEIPKICRRVVSRVAMLAVPVAEDAILRRYNVPAEEIVGQLRVSDSNVYEASDTVKSWVIARGRRISLAKFGAVQTSRGVTVQVKRGQRVEIPHAFLAETLQGYGRSGGKSKQAARRIMKNLKRQRDMERKAENARFASIAVDRAQRAEKWAARASAKSKRYSAATAAYQAQRSVLLMSGVTRIGVFVRKTQARLPIRGLYGGSIQKFFASGAVRGDLKRFCQKAISEQLRVEVQQFFASFKQK